VTPGDVESVCKRTEHALGEVKKRDVEGVAQIRDWHPAFAFTHVLQFAVEAIGHLPTYQEFRSYCHDDPVGQAALWNPAQEAIERAAGVTSREAARDAMRWRIGNAYYSLVRETFVLVTLRDAGLDVRVHPLADALFRVDLWLDDINVSLFIGNGMFRSGAAGRKERPDDILRDATPPFRFHSMQLGTQHRFGEVHLPSKAAIDDAAAALRD
jgi:hypothetical protein